MRATFETREGCEFELRSDYAFQPEGTVTLHATLAAHRVVACVDRQECLALAALLTAAAVELEYAQ